MSFGEEQDYPGMIRVLEEGMATDPDNPVLLCWLAVARREAGEEGQAFELFKAVLALQPEDPHVLATAGAALAHLDDPEAEVALRNAAMTAPELAFARLMYGAFLAREGLVDDALRELQAAAGLDEEDPQIPFELGVAYALAGDAEKARMSLARASELDPDDAWTRVVLGLVEIDTGDLDEAASDLTAGALSRPEDAEAQLLAALALGAGGFADRGYEMLERARLSGAEGDREALVQVEDRLGEGPEACLDYLTQSLHPVALRERLMVRP